MAKPKKIGIVEDEVLIANSLRRNLLKQGYDVLNPAIDFGEAKEMLSNETPDLILLDINLESDKSGIEVAQYIREKHRIPFIFITAHMDSETIRKVKSTQPAGYLIKPVQYESLFATMEIVLYNFLQEELPKSTVSLKTGKLTEKIILDEILYLKSDHVYVEVVLKDRKLIVRSSMSELLSQLPKSIFFQVHRSYAVNIKHVINFGVDIIHVQHHEIPVSRSYKNDLISHFN